MSATESATTESAAEPKARPKLSARAQLVKWLQNYLPVSEQDTTAELTKHFGKTFDQDDDAQARRLGGESESLIGHFIRECETEEQRAREQRHSKQQQHIERQIEQQAIAQQAGWIAVLLLKPIADRSR